MKKLLLAFFLGSASLIVNAQVTLVPIYGGEPTNPNDSVNSASGFAAFGGTTPGDWVAQEADEAGGNTYLSLEGSSDGYYVWGVNNGKYSAGGTNEPFGYSGAETGYVSLRVQVKNEWNRMKIGLQTTDGKTFAKEVLMETYPIDTWQDENIQFTGFRQEDANGNPILDGGGAEIPPSAADLANVGQINVVLLVNSGCDPNVGDPNCTPSGGWGVTERFAHIWVDDIFMTENALTPVPSISESPSTGISKVTDFISSSRIYPNPSTNDATVELNLKSTSNVKVTLSDMMGKEVMVIADENTASLNKAFNTSALTQGVYTVNYFINGAPAKSELLMVK